MCKWTITSRNPQAELDPVFDNSFDAHMKGREGGSEHSGLHTLFGEKLFEVENDRRDRDTGCSFIYRAKVRLGSKDQYNKVTWDDYKLSTFFPDDMCLTEIKTAVTYAWKQYKGLKNSSNDGHKQTFVGHNRVITGSNVKWVGEVKISHPDHGDFNVLIGSLQTGGGQENRIYNAFPAIDRSFF